MVPSILPLEEGVAVEVGLTVEEGVPDPLKENVSDAKGLAL